MIRLVLLAFGLFLAANTAWLWTTVNFTAGLPLEALAAACFLAFAVFWKHLPKGVLWAGAACLVLVVGACALLWWTGARDDATGEEDAVLVLGAAVIGRTPSQTLVNRLDAAIAFHRLHPEALLVVSGGQGSQEQVSEASAMADYLVAHGVPRSSVVEEDEARSTAENFAFSKAILDKRLKPGYKLAFVTNDYHVWRSLRCAEAVGVHPTHFHAATPWYGWPSSYLRELAAAVKSLATGQSG